MINHYAIEDVIGKGMYSTVKKCKDKNTGRLFAIKVMNKKLLMSKRQGIGGKTAYDSVIEEMKVLERMEHPNVMWLEEIINDPAKTDLYLVTEYYSGGNLKDMVDRRNKKNKDQNELCIREKRPQDMITKGITEWKARFYFIDMLRAIYYCHNVANVIHRDIKPDNVMINHNNEAVLIDFGVSALLDDTSN